MARTTTRTADRSATRAGRLRRLVAGGAAALSLWAGAGTAPALADSPSPTPSGSADSKPLTSAGTSFRTAAELRQNGRAAVSASTGDYLYWSFAANAAQRSTVKARVELPETAAGQSSSVWQLDVYDGLRRRQACRYGATTRGAAAGARTIDLTCALPTVRAWAESWSGDPLPGTYYIRLTAVGLNKADQGLPVHAEVGVTTEDIGGRAAVDGSLAEPLVPGIGTSDGSGAAGDAGAAASADPSASDSAASQAKGSVARLFSGEPEDGWGWTWLNDRWLWTAAGGVLAALAGIWGYRLTRGSGRPRHVPPPGA
ncbi:hypothetical protein [Streptomyces sp. NRRL S-87]|uniref:hypothetical protein n=1 Tax=Streptomyces sp. NRRL S-87 TaxID=1463920 RepID=UPI00068F9D53|nr:hypothetical protein [Streptomyces sp. NRRL S-87]